MRKSFVLALVCIRVFLGRHADLAGRRVVERQPPGEI